MSGLEDIGLNLSKFGSSHQLIERGVFPPHVELHGSFLFAVSGSLE